MILISLQIKFSLSQHLIFVMICLFISSISLQSMTSFLKTTRCPMEQYQTPPSLMPPKYIEVKEESEKVGLKPNFQKTKIMASGPITSCQIDEETMETVTDFVLGGLQNHCRWWLWKFGAEPWKTLGFWASRGEEFNLGPEMRLDRVKLLCNKVLLKYKRARESFWHRNQKGAGKVPPS